MSLEAFSRAVDDRYRSIGSEVTVSLDERTRTELAVLAATFEPESMDDLVRRAVHLLTRDAIDRGDVDMVLRRRHDVTYDEYLAGMTYEEMAGENPKPAADDDRRYRF